MGQERLYWHHRAPWVSWKASLQQWGWAYHPRQSCALPHSAHCTPPRTCTRLPTSTQQCPTGKTPWVGTAGTAHQPFRSTVCYCWPTSGEEKGYRREWTDENDALQNFCLRTAVGGRHGWMVLVGLHFAFFFKHQPGMRRFEKKSYGIKFLALPNLCLSNDSMC